MLSGCKKEIVQEVAPTPVVKVLKLQSRSVPINIQLPGRIAASETSEVRPQVDGLIVSRLFEEGDQVEEGQPLYRLDLAPYQAKVANINAALAKAKAAIEFTEGYARRSSELIQVKAISRQENENAVMQAEQAKAEVLLQQAALASAEIDLDRTTIKAPISGRIGRSVITVGGLATTGQDAALATIQRLDPIFVDITQPSGEVLKLRKAVMAGSLERNEASTKVRLFLEDGTEYPLNGVMKFTDVTVDSSTNTQTIRARFSNPDGLLLPGMYVRAELSAGTRVNAVLVPQRALGRDAKGNGTALIVSPQGILEARSLITERVVGDEWLVTSGLQQGDQVVVEGAFGLQPGTEVKTEEWNSADTAEEGK
ncbi:MAG: efflux RND transporter periplasmic adaptor subunit [Luteolibacter sp.]